MKTSARSNTNNLIEKEEVKNNVLDITNDSRYDVKKKQISLENIELKVSEENKLEISSKTNDPETIEDVEKLKEAIITGKGLEKALIKSVVYDEKILSIGYSEVDVELNEDNTITPVPKKARRLKRSMGDQKKRGKLTLYTSVQTGVYNGERFVVAYSDATWSGFDGLNISNAPASYEDYISITIPERYTIINDYSWATYKGNNLGTPTLTLTNSSKNSLIYSFDELKELYAANTYVNWLRIAARGKTSDLKPRTEMYSSQYVHTYRKINISPSINSLGVVNWGINNISGSWTLSSYASVDF